MKENLQKIGLFVIAFIMAAFMFNINIVKAADKDGDYDITYYFGKVGNYDYSNDEIATINSSHIKKYGTVTSNLYGDKATKLRNITNAGYVFAGWKIDNGKTSRIVNPTADFGNGSVEATDNDTNDFQKIKIKATALWKVTVKVGFTTVDSQSKEVSIKSGPFTTGKVNTYLANGFPAKTGDLLTIKLTPTAGYEIDTFKINNVSKSVTEEDGYYTYAIDELTENVNISVTYKVIKHTVTTKVKDNVGGTITASADVVHGNSFKITLNPAEHYLIDYLKVGDSNVDLNGATTYTIPSVTDDIEVEVAYKLEKRTVTTSVKDNVGGTITTSADVDYGSSFEIALTPDDHYEIDYLKIDGSPVDLNGATSYTILSVTADTNVEVAYKLVKHTVTTSVKDNVGGTISDGDDIEYGSPYTVVLSPSIEYNIDSLTINGDPIDLADINNNQYVIASVEEDLDIVVTYKVKEFSLKIKTSSDSDAKLPSDLGLKVKYGENKEIELKADAGYEITKITVNDEEVTLPLDSDILKIENITENTNVIVTIKKQVYNVVEGQNQKIQPGEELFVKFSGDLDLFVKLLLNGKEVDPKNYTATSGSTDITLNKDFVKTLKPGKYKLAAVYSNGNSAQTSFTIEKKAENPNTGDNIMLYVAIGLLSVAAGSGSVVLLRKKFD